MPEPDELDNSIARNLITLFPSCAFNFKNFPSIGCRPCTTQVEYGSDEREGRWKGLEKKECGIHALGNKEFFIREMATTIDFTSFMTPVSNFEQKNDSDSNEKKKRH